VCIAEEASATPAAVEARQEGPLTTTTVTYTDIKCTSAGVLHCPASVQSVHKQTGVETRQALAPEPLEFGGRAHSLGATSGRPTSWAPPLPTARVDGRGTDSQGTNLGLIIGLSVGLGILGLVAIFWGVL
jgi:hypothetical protein